MFRVISNDHEFELGVYIQGNKATIIKITRYFIWMNEI